MRRSTDIDTRTAAIDRLVQAGVAALPNPSTVAERHLGLMSVALASEQGRIQRTTTAPGRRVARRRYVVVGAMAALVALPSLALAGVLPDPVQRVASKVAAVVGVELPAPSNDLETRTGRGASDGAARTDAPAGTAPSGPGTDDERGHVNGTQPGKPEDGEQRGNRFGQVPEGPDQGKAGQQHGSDARPAKPAAPKPATPRPAKDPQPAQPAPTTPVPAEPAPATPVPTAPEPAAPKPGGGNGNAGGNGGGNGR